ncbi:MAG TPA: formate dehydrogenase accessory sulfurtransferase FdhD [Gaiellaceae bacterium]
MSADRDALEAPPYSASSVEVLRLPGGGQELDRVAVEEPLEIRMGGRPVAVTMRTPGHDEELALGFCLSEGLEPREASLPADLAVNTVEVDAPGFDPRRLERSFYTSSSCGVCGKGALEAVAVEAPRVESALQAEAELLADLPERLRTAQPAFAVTGGLHATGLFAADGELLCLREDVGRHNAMDKVVGWAFREGRLPLADGETLAERAWRTLGEACEERLALGKASDRLELPFDLVDDGTEIRAALAGIVAGLRAARHRVAVFLPVDVPFASAELLRSLGAACREAAVTESGPLPVALAREALPVLERRLAANELRLGDALAELDTALVDADPSLLVNVNRPADLAAIRP